MRCRGQRNAGDNAMLLSGILLLVLLGWQG
jgi:hypothetical protein